MSFWLCSGLIFIFGISVIPQAINGAHISFIETPKNVIANEGGRAHFNCSATSTTLLTEQNYFWKFNGSYVEENNTYGLKSQGRSLMIEVVNGKIHQGKYQCVVLQRDYGAIISLPAYLETTYIHISREYNTPYYVNKTSSLLIKAPKISARPEPLFSWLYKKRRGGFRPVTGNDTYVTKNGDLLITSISRKYSTDFKLYVTHAAEVNSPDRLVAEISVSVIDTSNACMDNSIVFPVKEEDRTLNEGHSLLLECTGVAKCCSLERYVYWEFISNGKSVYLPSRLFIKSIALSDAGTYVCHASVGNETSGYSITISVKGKPILWTVPPNDWDISSPTSLKVGYVLYAARYEWYTNGEMVTGSTGILRKNLDNSLNFLHLSKSLNGVYQIFYINGDLTTVHNFNIYATAKKDFGWRVFGLSGSIIFEPSSSHSSGTVTYSSWLIQVPAIKTVYLTVASPPKCASDGTTQLNIYQGSVASGRSVLSLCKQPKVKPVVYELRGPFITLVLVTSNLTNSAFSAFFDVNRPVSTLTPSTTITTKRRATNSTVSSKSATKKSTVSVATVTSTQASIKTTLASSDKETIVESNIGAIVGAIVGAAFLIIIVIIALFCYRQRQEQTKQPAQTGNFSAVEKGDIPQNLPRNTYLMRRPGVDQHVPCFNVQPISGRPMPDLIPEYDAVTEQLEMGGMGVYEDIPANQTYERVEDVLKDVAHNGPGIGNLAYEPTKSPKAIIGRRIPSGPGGQQSKFIRADVSPRPRDRTIMQQQQQLQDGTYNEVNDGGEYLEPVKTLPRVLSMEKRPLPTPSKSSPVYQTLEADEEEQLTPQGNDEYELANVDSFNESDTIAREDGIQHGASVYQPLTLERDAKQIDSRDDSSEKVSNNNTNNNSNFPEVPDDDYSDPYESVNAGQSADDDQNDYQPLSEYDSHNTNNNHSMLEARPSGCYASLEKGENTGDYEELTLKI